MISIFIIGIFIQTFIINKITKFPIILATSIAFVRNLGSLLYMDTSTVNDISKTYFPDIQSCYYLTEFTDFRFIGSVLYCNNILRNVDFLNVVYGIIGCISVSLLINLGDRILRDNILLDNKNDYEINIFRNDKFKLIKIIKLALLFDPMLILYTSAIGKDVFLFSFIISIIYFYLYPSLKISLFTTALGLVCLDNRAYTLIIIIFASMVAFLIPNLKIKNLFSKITVKFPRYFHLKITKNKLIILLILIPIFLASFSFLLKYYIDEVQVGAVRDLFADMNTSEYGTGGNLGFSKDLPFFIKFLYFWTLPLPFLQKGIGPFIFGISTFFHLFLIFRIFKDGITFEKYYSKLLLSIILIFSISFSIISYNAGITGRYKITTCAPPLYILFILSNVQYLNSKQKQIKTLQQIL